MYKQMLSKKIFFSRQLVHTCAIWLSIRSLEVKNKYMMGIMVRSKLRDLFFILSNRKGIILVQ